MAYEGTPEEICRNFKNHAMESLSAVLLKEYKNAELDKVACQRAMHYFNEAFKTGYKEY